MKSTLKTLAAIGLAASLGLGATSANAGVLASSTFTISDFVVSNSEDGTALALTSLSRTPTVNTNGALTTRLDSTFGPSPLDSADMLASCVGNCAGAPAENDFTVLTATNGNFSHADALRSGNFLTETSSSSLRSDVSLASRGDGSAIADFGSTISFSFNTEAATTLTFGFNAALELLAHVGPDARNAESQASSSISISINNLDTQDDEINLQLDPLVIGGNVIDLTDLGITTPCALNVSVGRDSAFPGTSVHSCSGAFENVIEGLAVNTNYQLVISHVTRADAELIPEPGTIALLGAGLFGLGMLRRRRKI